MSADLGNSNGSAGRGSGFGKRGKVELPSPPPIRPPEDSEVPWWLQPRNWVIGAVVGLFMLGLSSGHGGGLLGGLLGGWLAGKMINNASGAPKATPSTTATGHVGTPTSSGTASVQRGGFGATGSGFFGSSG